MLLPAPHPLQTMADRSVRRLRRLCAALAAVALLLGALSWPLAGALPVALAVQAPKLPIVLTTLAMILFLVSSRLRAQVLQRATGGRLAPDPATALAAYGRATLLSFAVLALAAGLGLGALLLNIVNEPAVFDWGAVAALSGAGVAVVLAVTALSLPPLWRVMRADGLRTE